MNHNYQTSIFSALADPRRQQIVELVSSKGQMSSTDISRQFQITSSAISQHLKVLKNSHVLIMEKQAQKRLYQINPKAFDQLEDWSRRMKKNWNQRFERLEELLKKNKK